MKSPEGFSIPGDGDGRKSGGDDEHFIQERLLRAQSGDERAKNDLTGYVWKVAYRRACFFALPAVYDKKDLAQDVVIKFLEQLVQIRNLRHWLVRVCIGAQSTAYRKHHQKFMSSLEILPQAEDDSFEARQLARIDVSNILDHLKPLQYEVMYLRYIDDLPFAEIAKMKGMKEGAVKTQFWRTKLKLQKLLGSNLGESAPS